MDNYSLRILVVEDDPALCATLNALIRQSGHRDIIETCADDDALIRALTFQPDVIITGHPPLSGDDSHLARQIRMLPSPHRPCLLLLGRPDDENERLDILEAGFDQFIDLPLRSANLAAQLRSVRRMACLQRENERYLSELQQNARELACTKLRVRELSQLDELTGLPNRHHAMELMQHEWSATAKDEQPLSCIAIDLDGLKQINDEQGHERGDVVLKTVAAIMRKYLAPKNSVCRLGGDEFLVICPGTALASALVCGEKLGGLVASFNIHAENHPLSLSIGVAERRPGIPGPQVLINLAEQAMHHAKHIGKNQVRSGHGLDLRHLREGDSSRPTAKTGRKKRSKQAPLWEPSEVMDLIATAT